MKLMPEHRYVEFLKILAQRYPEYQAELDVYTKNPQNFDAKAWRDQVEVNRKSVDVTVKYLFHQTNPLSMIDDR